MSCVPLPVPLIKKKRERKGFWKVSQVSHADDVVCGLDRIVGKGNHSPNHIQKIKPKVEQICQELGLQYSTEPNAGRMYINLQGGPAVMPEHLTEAHGGGYAQGYGGGHHGGGHQQPTHPQMNYQQQQQQQQGGYQGGQQQQGGGQQDPNAELEAEVKKYLPTVLRMCQRNCCTVM